MVLKSTPLAHRADCEQLHKATQARHGFLAPRNRFRWCLVVRYDFGLIKIRQLFR
jgi:hypothetical protein